MYTNSGDGSSLMQQIAEGLMFQAISSEPATSYISASVHLGLAPWFRTCTRRLYPYKIHHGHLPNFIERKATTTINKSKLD